MLPESPRAEAFLREFDIVIAGAGMVGATLASLLARNTRLAELSIGIIDVAGPPEFDPKAPAGLRVSALSPASRRILSAAGAWPDIAAARACPYHQMRVWDARPDNRDDPMSDGLHFDCASVGADTLGYIVENELATWSLHGALRARDKVSLIIPAELVGIESRQEGIDVHLDKSRVLRTHLLVGCDGAGSVTRELAGIGAQHSEYGQRGLVCVVETTRPHRGTAWQRFMPGGPLALLPLADGSCSIVWSRPEDEAQALERLSDAEFSRALTEASNRALGELRVSGARASFPLHRLHAKAYCQPGVALAGDAAHVVHPLAGQGANLGLMDAAALTQTLSDAVAAGEGPGDLRVLRRYERWRKGENLAMLAALDGISRLFSAGTTVMGRVRQGGLAAVNATPALKDRLARHALGLGGDAPRLLADEESVGQLS